ncbi:uncharacterized protein LOC141537065 isoform X2 [Cotesia typhae]|uniref:uncharacterized protein LOC141537065 isoform X2 n=1 Tax=Cotesia typhae TaxID=2053667 RepID=UPI003D69D465
MKRGRYKLHLTPEGNGIIPRSTFYRKLKQYRCAVTNEDNQIYNQNIGDDNTNANDQLTCEEIFGNNNSMSIETVSENNASLTYEQSSPTYSVPNSWFYEDYDDESQHRETWFDAEDSTVNYFYIGCNSEHNEQDDKEKDTDYGYNKQLCKCSTITRGEALMMTLALGAEESLTWKTIIAILSMINTLFQNDVVPASKYKLFKTLKLNEDILVYHIYCKECNNYIGAQKKLNKDEFQCKICDKNGKSSDIAYFLTFDISLQLKSILEDPEVQQFLMENRQDKRDDCNNSDLQNMGDGKIYKKLSTINNPLSEEYNFSYTFNTDGCQPSKSSKLSIWPIYARINEFSSKLQSKHMIMTGLWIDEKEPDMLLFLQPFVDEANKLSEKGVQWTLQQQTITSKFIPICAVVDSVARCKILNMKQYNGSYGCTFCEHRTERINNSQKYTVSMIVPRQRTDELIKEEMLLAGGNKYGVGKQHTDIVLSPFGEDYYVGNPNEVESINTKLLNFKHPTCITRSPRKVTEREMWKATEWRSWLLFYSLICLKGILPQKYLEHLALLVEALRILLSDRISHDELDTADSLILRYVVTYQEYFGKQAMTYNIHLLLHIVKSVKNLGPLWCHNTFIFENENHFLLKLQKSPNHITIQIARRYLFQKALSPLKNKINISQNFLQFCEKNLTGRLKNTFDVDGCILVGNGKKYIFIKIYSFHGIPDSEK